jgi:hypothetical protein
MSEINPTAFDVRQAASEWLVALVALIRQLEELLKAGNVPANADAARIAEQQAYTVQEWCQAQRISLSKWADLRKKNQTPRTMQVGREVRISVEASREWVAAQEAEAASERVMLERKRRAVLASRAGKIAAQSELHVSKQKKGSRKKPKDKERV